MKRRRNAAVLATYMALALAVLGGLAAQLNVTYPWSHPYTVSVHFRDAAGLLANNEVYENGVHIGFVRDVSVQDGQGVATLVITDTRALPLHTDASAEVRKKNLLGETYVDLQRGTAACAACTLATGATISVDHTVPITEIDQVLAIFDPTTVQRVQIILNTLGEATGNNGANLNAESTSTADLVTSLVNPATELSVRQQQVGDIVAELDRLYAMLARQRVQIGEAMTTWNQVVADLAAQDGAVGDTIRQADALVTSLDTLLAGEGANLHVVLDTLPAALASTETFLQQSGAVLSAISPYRTDIHDVFPHLASSFADTDPSGQHFWSVYAVNCPSSCTASTPAPAGGGSTASFWSIEGGAG